MNAKEYLSQVMHIDQRINSKLEQVVKLRESATKATATLSDMPRPDTHSMQTMTSRPRKRPLQQQMMSGTPLVP